MVYLGRLCILGMLEVKQKITPTLMFVGEQCGNAEEAVSLYTSIFKNSQVGDILRYGEDATPDKPGTVLACAIHTRESRTLQQWIVHTSTFYV